MQSVPEFFNITCKAGGSSFEEVCYTFPNQPGSEITNIPDRITHTFILLIFLISAGLRLGLVVFNRESNDDHFAVIQLILKTERLPEKADCWECYQPKLFHFTAAKFLQLTGQENSNPSSMILAVEMLNYTAGLITILVIGMFLDRLPGKNGLLKVIAFGLVALNPGLIGINAQVTNDTFAILFSTLALFCTYAFLQKKRSVTFLLMLLFTILGICSKTNVWITAIAILLALFVKAWLEKPERARMLWSAGLFGLASLVLSIFNPFNQYISNVRDYGSPIQLNIDQQPLPNFFVQTSAGRPGILSIQDGFFTFKFGDLLRYPRNENGYGYTLTRTSLWTQLYARANSVHFENWPISWSTSGEEGFALSRAIYILALLPTLVLLAGAATEIFLFLKSLIKHDPNLAEKTHFGLTAVIIIGFGLFIILYALLYRDFSVMKAIFLFPAMLTFPLLFVRAGEWLSARLAGRLRWVLTGFVIWMAALFILYSADIVTMAALLYSRRFGM
ncbi:MAG: glycosyltransferase family 39 protein [Anaerolineales bacterium]|jgi:hypothetical protein